jgi:hypothetical protein
MSQLRTKTALEEVLDKRAGVVEQLRSVLRGIDQASSDAEVRSSSPNGGRACLAWAHEVGDGSIRAIHIDT